MGREKLNILILAGGESTEREVSLNSARAVAEALRKSGHTIHVVDCLNGNYLTDSSGRLIEDSPATAHSGASEDVGRRALTLDPAKQLIRIKEAGIDVVFNALHGGRGENGGIQALLDIIGIPYTGSPMAASAIAMNKDIAKRVMRSLGIPTAAWERHDLGAGMSIDDVIVRVGAGTIVPPCVVKPTDGGSTVGLTLVETKDMIPDAVRAAFEVADSLIVEEYLNGREITIAVLDGRALPPVEIKPSHKLYDYTCKYTKGKSQYFCPADIDRAVAEKLAGDAVGLYTTIGCRGYARVDFIVAYDGSYICLELNTLPGMTALSLFPMAAQAAGIGFEELLDTLCALGMEGR